MASFPSFKAVFWAPYTAILPNLKSEKSMTHFYKKMKSPVGELTLIANEKKLIAILWEGDDPTPDKHAMLQLDNEHPILRKAATQLKEYFEKKRTAFDLPLEFHGTEF